MSLFLSLLFYNNLTYAHQHPPITTYLLSISPYPQYDIIKKMERMGKSVGMIAGQAEPTIIQPSQYRKRFSLAMERYFMTIPDKWITHES